MVDLDESLPLVHETLSPTLFLRQFVLRTEEINHNLKNGAIVRLFLKVLNVSQLFFYLDDAEEEEEEE
jgi:hypothetical protein